MHVIKPLVVIFRKKTLRFLHIQKNFYAHMKELCTNENNYFTVIIYFKKTNSKNYIYINK